jgi:hypothetical protein
VHGLALWTLPLEQVVFREHKPALLVWDHHTGIKQALPPAFIGFFKGQAGWRDRQRQGLASVRRASLIQTAQSTSCSPSTLQNSLTLWLTTVAPMASAWQAIQRSLAPIGVARRFRAVA